MIISLYIVQKYYFPGVQRSNKSGRRNSDGNWKWARSRQCLSMRVAGKWQRHTSAPYIPIGCSNRVLESVKRLSSLLAFSPVYYSALVARRYLKSGMSNADVARAQTFRGSNCRILLLFETTGLTGHRRQSLVLLLGVPHWRICDLSRSNVCSPLYSARCTSSYVQQELPVLNCNRFASTAMNSDIWPESICD